MFSRLWAHVTGTQVLAGKLEESVNGAQARLAALQSAPPKYGSERGDSTPIGCVTRGMQTPWSETPPTDSSARRTGGPQH